MHRANRTNRGAWIKERVRGTCYSRVAIVIGTARNSTADLDKSLRGTAFIVR